MDPTGLAAFGHTLVLVGAIQGMVVTGFLAFHPGGNRAASRLLAVLVFAVCVDMFLTFLYLGGDIVQFPHLISVEEPLFSTYGPLLFLYTKLMTDPGFRLGKRHALLFTPALLEAALWLPFYAQPAELKLHQLRMANQSAVFFDEFRLVWAIELLYNLVFISLAAVVLRRYEARIRDLLSDVSRESLGWLKQVVYVALFVALVQVALLAFASRDLRSVEVGFAVLYCFVGFLFYGIGYLGLRQPEVFSTLALAEDPADEPAVKKYAKSALPEERAERLARQLGELMDRERLFLRDDLKLRDVAERLSVSTNHLSQVINGRLGKSFLELVNTYRVAEACRLLEDSDKAHLALLAVAHESGFSSKSSFNKAFRAGMGTTPSQYRQGRN